MKQNPLDNDPGFTRRMIRKRRRPPAPERYRWLDQWMVAKGEPLVQLVSSMRKEVECIEQREGKRKRARRSADQRKHRARVNTLVSNLAYAVLVPHEKGRLAVRLGNRRAGMSRYDNPALGSKPTRNLVYLLDSAGVLNLHYPKALRGEVSSVAPTSRFAAMVREEKVSLADFARDRHEELIVLTLNKRRSAKGGDRATYRERCEYTDTRQTRRYRAEMRRLNSFLAQADIDFIEDGLDPVVDPFNRALRRHFVILPGQSQRFDQVGRLFGGFWETIKSDRRQNIRVNGEPVATLDFGSMFTRLAYARLGIQRDGDVYAVEGAEGYRSGIKRAMNVFLFDTSPRRVSWPKGMGVGVGSDMDAATKPTSRAAKYDARLPPGWTVGKTKKAILQQHPALKQVWGRGLGYRLMFDESRVLLAALNALMRKNVPALGLHDGLLVQRSKCTQARAAMERAAREIAGVDIPVSAEA